MRTLGLRAVDTATVSRDFHHFGEGAGHGVGVGREHGFALGGVHQLIHQAQPGHGVFGVADRFAVGRGDLVRGELFRERRAADQQRHADAGFFKVGCGESPSAARS